MIIQSPILQAMRPHQWVKNILLAVPFLCAHEYGNFQKWQLLLLGLFSFSFMASSIYILNDLQDIEKDKSHPFKKNRPFASGALDKKFGYILSVILFLSSFGLSLFLPSFFTATLLSYALLTTLYTLWLKKVVLLDCLLLSTFYTLRIVAGSFATSTEFSYWLMLFSGFLFLCLSFVKRYAELFAKDTDNGRGYKQQDMPVIAQFGITAGFASVLVLALYINDGKAGALYFNPHVLSFSCIALVFWIMRLWMVTTHGKMHADPIVWALSDKPSVLIGAIILLAFVLAGA